MTAGERASPSPPPAPPGPEVLRAVLHVLLRLACNGLPWVDPSLGTPIGEHITAEAIAVLQVGRRIFFPTPAKRRELLLRLLTRAPEIAALDATDAGETGEAVEMEGGGAGGGFLNLEATPDREDSDEGSMLRRLSEAESYGPLLPQAILTEVSGGADAVGVLRHPRCALTPRLPPAIPVLEPSACFCMHMPTPRGLPSPAAPPPALPPPSPR